MAQNDIQQIALRDLKPWVTNARTHTKKQIRQIADSIKAFGFTNPVLIDEHRTILAGHGRVEAAKLIGMGMVPCVRLDHMTSEEKRAYVLADNKLALNAGWDEDLLAGELEHPAFRLTRILHFSGSCYIPVLRTGSAACRCVSKLLQSSVQRRFA